MVFRIGPWRYKLRITDGPLVVEQQHASVAWLESEREILIAADCAPAKRLGMLFHGLLRVWAIHSGEPKNIRGWCDLGATAFEAAMRDLSAAGGVEALQRMRPGESSQPGASRITITKSRQCGMCSSTIAGGSVVCKSDGAGAVEMALYCPHCDHVQTWRELATVTGLPAGVAMGEPEFLRGAAVGEFLRANPMACAEVSMA